MDDRTGGLKRNSMHRVEAAVIAILVNVALSFLMRRLGLPIFLDSAGTIAVSIMGGFFPGIMTAVITNILCIPFDTNSLYFTVVQALLAIFISWFFKNRSYKRIPNILAAIGGTALLSGVLSTFIQWGLFYRPELPEIAELVDVLMDRTGYPMVPVFLFVNLVGNLLDKGLCMILAVLVVSMVPQKLQDSIRDSGWRQKPLTDEQVRSMQEWGQHLPHPIRNRITLMISGISLALVLITAGIGTTLFFHLAKEDRTDNARNAAVFAADVVDPAMLDVYMAKQDTVSGYAATQDLLDHIRRSAPYVDNLYVVKARDDGFHVIFASQNRLPAAYMTGDIIEFPEELEPYVSTLLEGGEIPALENNSMAGWMLSVFYPIERDAKATPCYVITEVSLEYMADYMKTFLFKVMLLLAGFFLLLLACGMWISGFFMVYPINTIAECVDGFVKAGDDQAALDENVRKLRSLDIQTQDETEKLYHSLCTMAAGMAEQLRDIRHYTDSTAQMQNGLIITMADMVENRDSDTGAHIQKTAAYVRIILDGLKRKGYYLEKLTPKYMEDVVMSAPLHDVGKINIPDAILNKPGKLTDEEYEIMKTHTTVGRIIMEKAISTVRGENYLKEARNMAGYHHERWDGKGYPEGLHGEVIPLSARIMAVADVFDALTSPRVYKPAFPLEKALEIITDGSGTQFDPKCVEAFMDSLAEVKLILMKYQGM